MSETMQYFKEILQYPRPSKREEKIRSYILRWAENKGFRSAVDATGNVVVYVPAKNSNSTETVILQAHMDMVCVKTPESQHDFDHDAIATYERDGFLYASETTLGADNGIGVAMSMAACDFQVHPALELVFTVDEEVGMSGVEYLDFSLLSGTQVINLDSESEKEICVSSAGGLTLLGKKQIHRAKKVESNVYRLSLSWMRGWHSGCEIHENRGNAIMAILEFLDQSEEILAIGSIHGGTAMNVIPSKADALIRVRDISVLERQFQEYLESLKHRFDCPELSGTIMGSSEELYPIEGIKDIVRSMVSIHSWVYTMSEKIPGLVETSMNLGVIHTVDDAIDFILFARSSQNSELSALAEKTEQLLMPFGWNMVRESSFPGWQSDPNSPLAQIASEEIGKVLGGGPKIAAIHAGLECGAMVSGLTPGAVAISIGPNIFEVHSVNERVEIASVERIERALEGILARI